MLNVSGLTNEIKKIAVAAVNSEKPCNIVFGTVTSVSPVKINIEQKLTLSSENLVFCRNVTDFELEITPIDWKTEENSLHFHDIKNKKKITVHNALKVGESVILMRAAGGQKYIVLDRVGLL